MVKNVILNNKRAAARAREILRRHIDLDDIVFVGAEPDENTITTLPSTFPQGDFRYNVCTVTKREKAEGKRLIEIVMENEFPYNSAENYFGNRSSSAVTSVLKASEMGILPFGYRNEHINQLNILFSLVFWTGCVSYGYVEVIPNEYNQTALDNCLNGLGYKKLDECSRKSKHRKKDEEAGYSVHNGAYYITDSALSRTFALLGLPYLEGREASKIGIDFPWYADFMYSDNQFKSQEKVETFRRIFMYSLLSNKTRGISSRESVAVDAIATRLKKVGEKLTKKVAQHLMMTFPGLKIVDGDLLTSRAYRKRPRSRQRYANRVHLYRENMQLVIKALGGDFKSETPNLEIRRLAANALNAYTSLQ